MAEDTTSQEAALIRARAAVDPGYVARLFQIESGGNPAAVTGSNRGLGQFGPAEEAKYGLSDANRSDPGAQSAAVHREAIEHAAALRKALGRDPTPGEQYLTHQQGIAGGPALLTADPSIPAWQAIRPFYKSDAMARLAITGNVPSNHPLRGQDADNVTAGDFRNLWVSKFERGLAGAGNQPAAPSPQSMPVAPMGGAPTGAAAPSQTGAVPVAAENAATGNDELLRTLQTLSAPRSPAAPQDAEPQINYPQPRGLQLATALARAMGREKIA